MEEKSQMNKKVGFVVVALLLVALALAACGGGQAEPEIVEVEVTRIVEVEAAGGEAAPAEEVTFELIAGGRAGGRTAG